MFEMVAEQRQFAIIFIEISCKFGMERFGWKVLADRQPSPTTGRCLNGSLGWLEVECNRCKTRASLPLDTPPPARHAAVETGSVAKVPLLLQGPHRTAGAHGNRLLTGHGVAETAHRAAWTRR
jgi:hypothetical protein